MDPPPWPETSTPSLSWVRGVFNLQVGGMGTRVTKTAVLTQNQKNSLLSLALSSLRVRCDLKELTLRQKEKGRGRQDERKKRKGEHRELTMGPTRQPDRT